MRWLVGALSLVWVVLAWAGEPVAPVPKPLEAMTNGEKLLLFDRVSLGLTREELAARVPDVREWRKEAGDSLAWPDLARWSTVTVLIGLPAKLEFSYQGDSLYAFGGSMRIGSPPVADSLCGKFVAIYSERYGTPGEEQEREPDHEHWGAYWYAGEIQICVGRSRYGDHSLIGWSFQPLPKPHRFRR